MKAKLLLIIATVFLACPLFAKSPKYETIAVTEPVDVSKVYGKDDLMFIENTIADVLRKVGGFKVLDRRALPVVLDEHRIRSMGLVKRSEMKKIGNIEAADLVLYTELSPMSSGIYISCKAMDVATAEVVLFGDATAKNIDEIDKALTTMLTDMLGSETEP